MSFFGGLGERLGKVPGAWSSMLTVRRSATYRVHRCFRVPRGKTYGVIPMPQSPDETQLHISVNDYRCWQALVHWLSDGGRRAGNDFELCLGDLTPELHGENLVLICGPSTNLVYRELRKSCSTAEKNTLLRTVDYAEQEPGRKESRYFTWQGKIYRASESVDYACVAIRPNPLNPVRRLYMLFGLTDAGTLGAGLFLTDPAYASLREEATSSWPGNSNFIEVLLRVEHSPTNRTALRGIRLAAPANGVTVSTIPTNGRRKTPRRQALDRRSARERRQHERRQPVTV